MTLDELQKRFPDATAETWHQHPNGGGWVENTAIVDATAYVGTGATICGRARIAGDARISDRATIAGDARIGDCATICGDARIGGDAMIGGDARVTRGEWTASPLYIQGTRHSLNMDGDGLLRIGCILKPIAWWLENNVRCGEENGYTPEQIVEYRRYIELAAAMYGSGK